MTSNLVKRPVLGGVWCSPPLAQRPLNAVAPHRGLGYLEREPHAHVFFQPNAVHVVVDGFLQPCAQRIVVHACGVDEGHIVLGKGARGQRGQVLAPLEF